MSDHERLDLTPLGKSIELFREGDSDGALRRLSNFAISVCSGIPGLGAVVEELSQTLETSQGRWKRALRELEAEDDQVRGRKAIAAAVVEALKDVVHEKELTKEARDVALQTLQARRTAIEAALEAGVVAIRQGTVERGAIGVTVARGATRGLDISQERVTGPGTRGVKVE